MEQFMSYFPGFRFARKTSSIGSRTIAFIVMFLSILFSDAAFADINLYPLQRYAYEELTLVKVQYRGKKSVACFASIKGDIVWVGKGSPFGNVLGTRILRIEKKYVVVEETILVNEDDWIPRDFNWPVAAENHVLSAKCGSPPTQKAQLDRSI